MRGQDEVRAAQGFWGVPPSLPGGLVERPDVLSGMVRTVRSRPRLAAVTGIAGAGKSTLAARACADRSVRRAFRDGIAWLEAGLHQDPVALLATLAHRLGLPDAAASFAAVEQGREQLVPVLRGKRLLIVVNDVWARPPLDALADLSATCTVLFTTRLAELAAAVKATEIEVGALSPQQALELLGRCTGQAPAALPGTANALCACVERLALGVALAGGIVSGGESCGDVLHAIQLAPVPAGADEGSDLAHDHPDLLRAIGAGIAGLPEADQRRYGQLAVFAARGPFPRAAARALWRAELPAAQVDRLLATLTGRSLLTACGADWYRAHDLLYDVLLARLGEDSLAAAHSRLLAGYRIRYPAGWADSAADPYLGRQLTGHLHDARRDQELRAVLADAGWIQGRLTHGHAHDLMADYAFAGDPLSRQILRTLRLAAPALAADPGLLRSQLVSRLLQHPDPGVAAWAAGLSADFGASSNGAHPQLARLAPVRRPAAARGTQVCTGHDGSVRGVTVTPDGTRAVSGGEDGTVRVWDLTEGRECARLTGHTDWVREVAVTSDGTRAVSGGDDGTVRVWDLADGREQASLTGHACPVWSVAVTPDGTRAVSGGEDGTVRVWDLAEGREQASLTGHAQPVWSVAVTPDGTRAVSGSGDGTVRVWDLAEGREQTSLAGGSGEVFAVAVTPDGTRAVSSGGDGTVRVWDLAKGRAEAALTGHTGWVWSVAVTSDGTHAMSGGEDTSVRVWDLNTGREEAALTSHSRQVFAVALTPDGTRAVSGGADGTMRVWELGGLGQAPFAGHTGWVWSGAVTPDGTRAVSGGSDGTVRLWDLSSGGELTTLAGHSRPVWSVAVTPDGTRAVSGGSDRMVRVWDLAAGGVELILAGHARPVWSVAVTPDGTRAVSGGADGTVRVWDLDGHRELAILAGHDGGALAVAITPDGNRVVSGGTDGTVQVRDLARGPEPEVLPGHDGSVWSVAVTPDGSGAVSGGADGTLRVWDLKASRQEACLTGHTGQVFAVAVTPDGVFAASGGDDASVRLWNLTSGSELARWIADHPVVGLSPLTGQPLRIGVGPGQGRPCVLELTGMPRLPAARSPAAASSGVSPPAGGRHARQRAATS